MRRIVTGFTPFDGREINGSWVAAKSVDNWLSAEIPVVWGAPAKVLNELNKEHSPEIIVSLGEGREGWFDLESKARNQREEREDNHQIRPDGTLIDPGGPAAYDATADLVSIARRLSQFGYPIRRSADAGQFLCEETLYVLEQLKQANSGIKLVLFCHVPPFGTRFRQNGKDQLADEGTLAKFARELVDAVIQTVKT